MPSERETGLPLAEILGVRVVNISEGPAHVSDLPKG